MTTNVKATLIALVLMNIMTPKRIMAQAQSDASDWVAEQIGYEDNQKALAEAKQLENVESNASKRIIADAGRSMQRSRAPVTTSAATKAERVGAGLQTAGTIASMAGAGRVGGYLVMARSAIRSVGAIRQR
jgi:hypothetical protein